jgi:poly(A) polymerase
LGFKIEAKTAKPLTQSATLLADVPQSRLFDEMLKLLQTGHSLASIAQLKHLGLATGIYPLLDVVVERADSAFVNVALADTDRRVGEGKPVAPSFLLACVLWADVREGWAKRLARKEHPHPALQDAIDEVFDARIGDVSGRGKLAADMREIWMMQPRFEKRVGSTPFGLVEQPRFRAGFDFLRLRADIDEVDVRLADWWQEFSMASDAEREDLVQSAKLEQQTLQAVKPRVRRAPRPEGATVSVPSEANAATTEADNGESGAPKKRRRRRRKPGEGGDVVGDSGNAA